MAPPIVLLDEEQTRTLQATHARTSSNGAPPSRDPYRNSSFGANSSNQSYPMTPTNHPPYESRTNFTSNQPPRTNFTTGATQEPRTNFTSAASARRLNDHVAINAGGNVSRGTDLSSGQRSNETFTSSPRTNFTARRGPDGFDPNIDYTPVRLSDRMSSSSVTDEDHKEGGNGYAGSSSGLKLSITYILVGVAVGLGLGVLFTALGVSPLAAKWISLPGDLFLRALNSLVLPYVFCSVAVAIGDIVFVGKVSVVGFQTFKVFLFSWITTATMGMGIALLFRPLFRLDKVYVSAPTNAVGFTCPNNNLLQMLPNSTIACVGNVTELGGIVDTVAFEIADVNSVFEKNVKNALARMSVSDQILSILNLIVPKNIFLSLSNADVLSTITFAMVFGAIAGRNYFTKTRKVNYLYLVLLQLRNTFFLAMEWVIWLTPMAVVSIIAGSFATNQTAVKQFGDVYMYVVAIICAMVLQVFVTLPFLIFLLTRCNPYHHMKFMKEAYVFAFGSASSLATAPVTLSCVKKARVCSQSLANFVISIGVCSNTSGNGFYHPIAMVFLAESSGNGSELTALRLLAIYLLAIFACAGTPPIPSGGIVLMATVYKTVFGVSDTPATFPLFIAMDFFVDRLITICNVNDDIMALKVIAENTDETIVGDHLGERE